MTHAIERIGPDWRAAVATERMMCATWCRTRGEAVRWCEALEALRDDGWRNMAADMVAGLRYVRTHNGPLPGVAWDRVDDAHQRLSPHPYLPPPPAAPDA